MSLPSKKFSEGLEVRAGRRSLTGFWSWSNPTFTLYLFCLNLNKVTSSLCVRMSGHDKLSGPDGLRWEPVGLFHFSSPYLCFTHTDWSTVEKSSGRWRRWSWGGVVWGPGWSEIPGSPSDLSTTSQTLKHKQSFKKARMKRSVPFNTNLVQK